MNIEGIKGELRLDVSQAITAINQLEARLNKLGSSQANDANRINKELVNIVNRMTAVQKSYAKQVDDIFNHLNKSHKAHIDKSIKLETEYTQKLKNEVKKRSDSLINKTTSQGKTGTNYAPDLNDRIIKEERAFLARRLKQYQSFGTKITNIMRGIIWAPIFINNSVFMFQGVFNSLGRLWDSTIGQVIRVNSEIENYITRLKVSTGTLMAAKEVWEDVSKFATESVYGFDESVQAATSLLPILRTGREELKQWLPIIGDIAAGFGLSYQEATGNFIKAYAGGIAAADLFREKGVSAALGFTPGQKYSGRDTADQILKEWKSVNSVFRGASGELSTNWSGIVNKMKDQWFLFVKDIGEADLFKDMKFALQFALNKFEEVRGSGQGYKKLVDTIANTLKEVFFRTVNVFKALFQGIRNMWFIGDMISDAFRSDKSVAIDDKIKELQQRKDDLQTSMFTRSAPETAAKVQELNNQLTQLKEVQKSLDDPFYDLTKLLDDSVKEWDSVTGSIEGYKKSIKDVGELPIDPHIMAAQGIKERKIDANRKKALLDKQNEQVVTATREALEKVRDIIEKARLDSIRFSQGEWSAFVAETQIEARKLGEKISDAIAQSGANGSLEAAKVQGSYFKAMLDSRLAEYRQELTELQKEAQLELKSLSMTDSEKERANVENSFQDYKWLNLPPQLMEQVETTKQMQLATINTTESINKQNQAIQHQASILQSAIPEWNAYGRQLNQIQADYAMNSINASQEKLLEATIARDRATKQLDASYISNYKQQMEDLKFEIGNINLTDSEIELRNFNQELSRLVSPEFKSKFPALAKEMEALFQKKYDSSQIVTFEQGWNSALTSVKNDFMTQGAVIKEFMEDTFSGLSDALEDGFFSVMKGNFKDAAEAFNSFADSILKSISRILSNQVASQLVSGFGGMMAGFFHDGGLVTAGGGSQRQVNPLWFANAPRFHSGGPVGLRKDEIPAVLQAGEYVLEKGSWSVGSGIGKPQTVKIVNESGHELKVSKANTSSDIQGEVLSIFLDGYSRNKMGLRDMFGR